MKTHEIHENILFPKYGKCRRAVDLQNCLNFRCRFPGIICKWWTTMYIGTGLSDQFAEIHWKRCRVCIPSRSDYWYEDEVVVGINLKVHSICRKEKNDPGKWNLTQDYVEVVDIHLKDLCLQGRLWKTGVPDKIISFYMMILDYARRALNYTKIRYIPSAMLQSNHPVRDKKQCMTWKITTATEIPFILFI